MILIFIKNDICNAISPFGSFIYIITRALNIKPKNIVTYIILTTINMSLLTLVGIYTEYVFGNDEEFN